MIASILSILKQSKPWIMIGLCAIIHSASASSEAFIAGSNAYEAGQFSEAIQHFEASLQEDAESAAIRHNLALAAFQNGSPAEAVWQLERANRLAPRNHEIIAKLQLLKEQLNLTSSELKWYDVFARLLSLKQWALLSTLLFWCGLACIWILPAKTNGQPIKLVGYLCFLFLSVSLAAGTLSYQDYQSGTVISETPLDLRAAPASAAPSISRVSPGEFGRIINRHEAFLKIKTPNGASGWIAAQDFRPIYQD